MKTHQERREEKKKRIIIFLNKGKFSTNKIAKNIKANAPYTLELLEELKKENKVKEYEETLGVFWSLK